MKKIKVLYVEDEPSLGRIVKESLESRELSVHMVHDGAEAIKAYSDVVPDVCVLDVMLPNRDGYSIAKDIRRLSPQIPIIFLTAKGQTEDVIKGFDSGGNDYLRKPFSMEELIARIKNLLSITSGDNNYLQKGKEEFISIGSFKFYTGKYELQKNNSTIKLSYREATLLKILAENQHKPVLRKDILLELWGDDSFFNSRNLDVYISKLREYFKSDNAIKIVTLRGVGYHLVVVE